MQNKKRIYLDNAATTPVDKEVLNSMLPYFIEKYGNASSIHTEGQISRDAIDESRLKFARLLNCDAEELVFTGGGTESDNIAILGVCRQLKHRGKHIITSSIEHSAVLKTFKYLEEEEGFEVTRLAVDSNGIVSLDELKNALRTDTIFVSVMMVNNEIGTIQPIKDIAEECKKRNIITHTDAVQAFGKLPIDLKEIKIDLLSASAHKIHGPKGVGLLFIRNKGMHPKLGTYIRPITFGGKHEFGFRPSTENVAGIVGFARAFEISCKTMDSETKRLTKMRDDFIQWVLENIPGSMLNGDPKQRIYHNINLSFDGIDGESLVMALDSAGIASSTGSACHSGSPDPSHVLLAIGRTRKEAYGSLRLTMGKNTTKEDMENVKLLLKKAVDKLRRIAP